MESSPVIGYVILAITLAVGLGIGIIFLVLRNRWQWPKGKRVQGKYRGYLVHLVYDNPATLHFPYEEETEKIARRCALAVACLDDAWEARHGKRLDLLRETCVHVASESVYEELYDDPIERYYGNNEIDTSGVLKGVRSRTGSNSLPLAACRARKFSSTPETGGLVIHEFVHLGIRAQDGKNGFPTHDAAHESPEFWLGAGGDTSVEGKARALFARRKSEVT